MNFAQPVLLYPNTTYVVSYFAPKGHYSQDEGYFYTVPPLDATGTSIMNSPPLHALLDSNGVTNGVYSYAPASTFPTSTFNAENYWVDVVFSPAAPPGQAGSVSATAGYASASVSWTAPSSGGPATTYTITPYIGSVAQTPTTVTGSPAPTSAIVTGLTNGSTYTFTVTASNPNGSGPPSAASNAVTPSASASLVQNGGFENGLTSWTPGGVALPTATSAQVHSGSGAALLGTVQPAAEPLGDSNLAQTITVPSAGTTTLSFWYRPSTADSLCSGSSCQYDWQEAQIRNTSGHDAGQRVQEQLELASLDAGYLQPDAVRGPERGALVQRARGRIKPARRHLDVPGRRLGDQFTARAAGRADRGDSDCG